MTISTAAVVQPVDPADDDVETMTLAELRARRRRLLDEASRVAHWRRLAQARLDLAVADALSGDVWAPTSHGDASSWRTLVLGEVDVGSEDVAVRLRRLDEAGRSLRAYDAEVRQQLAASTQELVRRYHAEPSACLAAVPRDA